MKLKENNIENTDLLNYFAGKAMQGFIMDEAINKESDTSAEWLKKIATCSYELASYMLEVRKDITTSKI